MTRELLASLIEEAGLGPYRESIEASARDCVRLRPEPTEEHRLRIGASRLGGVPDLPAGAIWPKWKGHSLAFIAQLDLAQVAPFPAATVLPSTGTLSFLYNAEQDTWGFDPKDSGSFQVAYSPPTGLTRQDLPPDLPEHGRFGLCELTFEPAVSLPPLESHAFESLATRVPRNALDPLYDELADHQEWASRSLLLGYPDQIQGDMQTECALVSGGLYCGDAAGYRDPRAAGLRKQAPEWQLLLQVASEDAAHMMWGDLGCLYYWMRTPALVAQRFADAWLILQCS